MSNLKAESGAGWMRTEMPVISVAIITYNQKEFLQQCIESILAQDYPHLEIVIADDASSDGTPEMLRRYDEQYPDLFRLVLSEQNRGITCNANCAFHACTGKYIAWMGGDDLMLPGKLKKQVVFMEQHPDCVISYHNLDVFESQTGKSLGFFNSGKHCNHPHKGSVAKLIEYGTFCGACSVMMVREACPSYGFHALIPVASDWFHYIETASNGGSVRYLPEVLGRYRRHSGNVTNTSGISIDQMVTLALVDHKYPHFSAYARRSRARFLYSRAVENILAGKGAYARGILLESFRQGWVSWKWVLWFLRSFIQ